MSNRTAPRFTDAAKLKLRQRLSGWGDFALSPHRQSGDVGCTIRYLPQRLLGDAIEVASRVNPANAPLLGPTALAGSAGISAPEFATLVVSKYWGPTARQLTVSFMQQAPADLRARILSHMNAWTKTSCVSFVETMGTGNVRISFGPGGYWSYLGTDVLLVPASHPTMNLQAFSILTPESEYKRVVRHETGHTIGFAHEHMRKELVARIDPEKAYSYFYETEHWDRATVDAQVLTPLDEASIMGTPVDQDSIMCYQLPGAITKDGRPIRGGTDIDESDYAFAGKIYPLQTLSMTADDATLPGAWSEAEDLGVAAALARLSG